MNRADKRALSTVSICVCVYARAINLLTRDRMMDNGSLLSKYDRNC